MGLFDFLNKKERENIEGEIRYVTTENGDKYLHIQDFNALLEKFKNSYTNPSTIIALDQIIDELNKA